jgi:hypothetical protein
VGVLNGPLEIVIDLVGGADVAPDVLLQRLSVDPAGVYASPSPGLPSMQSPSLADWSLSPDRLPAGGTGRHGWL